MSSHPRLSWPALGTLALAAGCSCVSARAETILSRVLSTIEARSETAPDSVFLNLAENGRQAGMVPALDGSVTLVARNGASAVAGGLGAGRARPALSAMDVQVTTSAIGASGAGAIVIDHAWTVLAGEAALHLPVQPAPGLTAVAANAASNAMLVGAGIDVVAQGVAVSGDRATSAIGATNDGRIDIRLATTGAEVTDAAE